MLLAIREAHGYITEMQRIHLVTSRSTSTPGCSGEENGELLPGDLQQLLSPAGRDIRRPAGFTSSAALGACTTALGKSLAIHLAWVFMI